MQILPLTVTVIVQFLVYPLESVAEYITVFSPTPNGPNLSGLAIKASPESVTVAIGNCVKKSGIPGDVAVTTSGGHITIGRSVSETKLERETLSEAGFEYSTSGLPHFERYR